MRLRLLLVSVMLLMVSCQGSGSSGLSITDRTSTAQVCVQVGGSIKDAVSIGVQVAAQSITPAQAGQHLQPIKTKVDSLASANASLPVSAKLTALSTAITGVTATSSTDPSAYKSSATALRDAAQAVLGSCAAVAH